jgi:hypothetical protein
MLGTVGLLISTGGLGEAGSSAAEPIPVGHWNFDEGSGTTAFDMSGNGNNGTIYGADWVTGLSGTALEFDGVGDYVDCGNNPAFDITSQITIAAWLRTNDAGNGEHNPYVTKGDHSYALKHFSNNSIEFFIYDAGWRVVRVPVDASFNGVWHHLAGTYDGFFLKLYVDGTLEAAGVHGGPIGGSSFHLNIARNSEMTDRHYDGLIDDVRIYNTALSANQVAELCNLVRRTLIVSSTAGGSVTVPGEGSFQLGHRRIEVRAAGDATHCFVEWTGSAVDAGRVKGRYDARTTVMMDADYTLVANFELCPYQLVVSSTEGGSVTEPGEGTFGYENSRINIMARPEENYIFVEWTGTGVDAGKVLNPYDAGTRLTVDADYTLVANFVGPVAAGELIASGLPHWPPANQYHDWLRVEGSLGGCYAWRLEHQFNWDTGEYDLVEFIRTWTGDIPGWVEERSLSPYDCDLYLHAVQGPSHGLALRKDGSILAWGIDDCGQATPPAGNDFVAIAAGYYHSIALKSDGSIVAWGDNTFGQTTAPAGNDFVEIAAGLDHNIARRADGSLVGWGFNGFGQTSVPAGKNFVQIAAGEHHSLALRSDGSIAAWGSNRFVEWDGDEGGYRETDFCGQATPPQGNDFSQVAAGCYHGLALRENGLAVGWGENRYGQAAPPIRRNYLQIAAGSYVSFAIVEACQYDLAGDVNDDCKFDFVDLALMAGNWLAECPGSPGCVPE